MWICHVESFQYGRNTKVRLNINELYCRRRLSKKPVLNGSICVSSLGASSHPLACTLTQLKCHLMLHHSLFMTISITLFLPLLFLRTKFCAHSAHPNTLILAPILCDRIVPRMSFMPPGYPVHHLNARLSPLHLPSPVTKFVTKSNLLLSCS